jgi:hypothetical protein
MTENCSCLPCEINNAIDRFCLRHPRVSGEHIIASLAEVSDKRHQSRAA